MDGDRAGLLRWRSGRAECASLAATTGLAPPVARTAGVQAEIDALLAFCRGLRDPYSAMSGWDAASTSAPCSWRGVACAQGGRVVELPLPRLRLWGPISRDGAGDVARLRRGERRTATPAAPRSAAAQASPTRSGARLRRG